MKSYSQEQTISWDKFNC